MRAGLVFLLLGVSSFGSRVVLAQDSQPCKYGLAYGSAASCSSREAEALQRVTAAKTICLSANSQIEWNKKTSKEPTWAWSAIRAGEFKAVKFFRIATCDHADLVTKYVYDDTMGAVTLDVTDADSGEKVFEENRSVSDLTSDTVRMASHWNDMVNDAHVAARAAAVEAEAAAREHQEQAKQEEEAHKCETEFESLKRNIISYLEVQHATALPPTILDQIAAHNEHCTNSLSPEEVIQQEKTQADEKHLEDERTKDKELQNKRAARLAKEKTDALTAIMNKLISDAYVPPLDGWTRADALPSGSFYIILPGIGFAPNCHFALDNQRPALDCLGAADRSGERTCG